MSRNSIRGSVRWSATLVLGGQRLDGEQCICRVYELVKEQNTEYCSFLADTIQDRMFLFLRQLHAKFKHIHNVASLSWQTVVEAIVCNGWWVLPTFYSSSIHFGDIVENRACVRRGGFNVLHSKTRPDTTRGH